jgi:hypothetical protein
MRKVFHLYSNLLSNVLSIENIQIESNKKKQNRLHNDVIDLSKSNQFDLLLLIYN